MALRNDKTKDKTLLDQAQDYVEAVRPHVESAVATTKDAIGGFVETTAAPAIADAKAKAAPIVADAKAKAAPVVADLAARAQEAAAHAQESAEANVATPSAEEPEKKKGGRLKKVALLAAIAGAIGFVAKKLQGGAREDNWQSSYVPKPAPAPPAPASSPPTDDAGGSAPDEAIADAAEDPKPVTTPDEPAEVVDLDGAAEAETPPKRAAKKS